MPSEEAVSSGAGAAPGHDHLYQEFFEKLVTRNESEDQFLARLPHVQSGAAQQLIQAGKVGAPAGSTLGQLAHIFDTNTLPVTDLNQEWQQAAASDDESLPTEEGDWVDLNQEQTDEHGVTLMPLGKEKTACILDASGLAVQVDNLTVAPQGAEPHQLTTATTNHHGYVPTVLSQKTPRTSDRAACSKTSPSRSSLAPNHDPGPVVTLESLCPRPARKYAGSISGAAAACAGAITTATRNGNDGDDDMEEDCSAPVETEVLGVDEHSGRATTSSVGGDLDRSRRRFGVESEIPGQCGVTGEGDVLLAEQLLHAVGGDLASHLGLQGEEKAEEGNVQAGPSDGAGGTSTAVSRTTHQDVNRMTSVVDDAPLVVEYDQVEAFSLDPTFDYDDFSKLTPRMWPPPGMSTTTKT